MKTLTEARVEELLGELREENARLKDENLRFENVIRSTLDLYKGLEVNMLAVTASVNEAKLDCSKLVALMDQRNALRKAAAEAGVQGEGTG